MLPTFFIPHGGGPWPLMRGFVPDIEYDALSAFLSALPAQVPDAKSILVVSAHWEADLPTVQTSPRPPLFYDYYGFPPEAYEIKWPAPGSPALAQRVRSLLAQHDIESAEDPERGYDHGAFIPLMVAWPEPTLPTVQLSLKGGLDPATHIALGRALQPLRDEGVLVIGSGMSFHNMRGFFNGSGREASETFDAWLTKTATAAPAERDAALIEWSHAPASRLAHPREEHLMPLHVVAGAANADAGVEVFNGTFGGARIAGFRYG